MTCSNKDLEIAKSVVEKIESLLGENLKQILLFGSRARGDSDRDSDFDFLVLGDFQERSWPKRSAYIRKGLKPFDYSMDLIAITEEEFHTKLLIRDTILKEGVLLYEIGKQLVHQERCG